MTNAIWQKVGTAKGFRVELHVRAKVGREIASGEEGREWCFVREKGKAGGDFWMGKGDFACCGMFYRFLCLLPERVLTL